MHDHEQMLMAKRDAAAPSFGNSARTKALRAAADADATIRRTAAESTCVDEPPLCLFELVKLLDSVPGLRAMVEEATDAENDPRKSVEERLRCFMHNCCAVRFDHVEIRRSANMILVSGVEWSGVQFNGGLG